MVTDWTGYWGVQSQHQVPFHADSFDCCVFVTGTVSLHMHSCHNSQLLIAGLGTKFTGGIPCSCALVRKREHLSYGTNRRCAFMSVLEQARAIVLPSRQNNGKWL